MGWSGKTGKVYYGLCARTALGAYTPATPSTVLCEVLSWDADADEEIDAYGHSESSGFRDTCIGTQGVKGTVELKLQGSLPMTPGKVYSLLLQNAAISLSGMAVFDGVPISTKINGGQAVSATYRFQSKLAWVFAAGTGLDGNT